MKKRERSAKNPLSFFDAIFYVCFEKKSFPFSIGPEVDSNQFSVRNIAVILDDEDRPNYDKTKLVIFKKSKRDGFKRILVMTELLDEFSDSFLLHLEKVVEHMIEEDWVFWQIETLNERELTSTFYENFKKNTGNFYSLAINMHHMTIEDLSAIF